MDQLQSLSWPDVDLLSISWLITVLQRHIVTVAATIAISALLVVFYWGNQNGRLHRMPPGPRPWPIVGNLGIIGHLAHQDFQKLAQRYGPIFRLRLGSKETIIISSPKIAEEILKTHDLAFASRPKTSSQFIIMHYNSQTVAAAPYGPYWRYARKVFTLELLTNKRIQEFQNVRKEEVLSGLYSLLDECKDGNAVRLNTQLGQFSVNNITRMTMNKTFFGPNSDAASENSLAEETIKELFALNGVFNIGDYIPFLQPFDLQRYRKRMRAVVRQLDNFLEQIIESHRRRLRSNLKEQHSRQGEVMDIVDLLLTRPTEIDHKPLTDTQIKAILMEMVIGGDTSSNTLEWAMTELLRHPVALQKAQEELDAVVGLDRLVEEEDIPSLKYLRCIVKETIRLHPLAPLLMPHECMESREVAGYQIPVKCQVFINVYAIGRDPEVWERPLEFYPERFLSTNIDLHGKDFELLPFGFGRRSCPGKNLALIMVEYMLAVLLHACNWALPPGLCPQDVDLEEAPGSAVPKRIPLEANASPRLPMDVITADRRRPSIM